MKVYVLLNWYYDGDSYLSHSFEGVFSSYEKALNMVPNKKDLLNKEDFNGVEPKDWGGYNSESKYEIRECDL